MVNVLNPENNIKRLLFCLSSPKKLFHKYFQEIPSQVGLPAICNVGIQHGNKIYKYNNEVSVQSGVAFIMKKSSNIHNFIKPLISC